MASPAELKERIEAERRMEPFLLYRDPGGQRIVALGESGRVSIGRDGRMDLSLDDEQVSLLHAEVHSVHGQWTIVDDGLSRNGTFLNGERVSGRHRLRDGDELRFGETVVVFRDPRADAPRSTAIAPGTHEVKPLTESQRRILIALSRPFKHGTPFATPATNKEIAEEVSLSVPAVKGHLRVLFERFELGDAPHNEKRARLVEMALKSRTITTRDL
jgi:pSer/pThr/pTyr-binding forkhead associated (FHA) protein